MRYAIKGLRRVLVWLLIMCVWPAGAGAVVAPARQSPGGGAAAERERGRALLRRGRAAEALVHLERALQLFVQEGGQPGAALTRDLLGELYERQGRYDLALEHYEGAHQIFAELAARDERRGALAGALSARWAAYNANLMLAKVGQMHFRRGDAARARQAFSRMQVRKPDNELLKAAESRGGSVESKVGRLKGLGGRLRGLGGGRPSTSTPGAAADVAADAANTVNAPINAYRETVIYTAHELGLGRVSYLEGQLDAAGKHFENVLAATLGSLPVVGKLGQTRRYRTAARTALGDIAHAQGRFADAVKLYAEAERGARSDERLDLAWPAQRGTGRSLWAQAAREPDAQKAAKLREDSAAAYRGAIATVETIRQGSLRADESRTTFLATTEEVFEEAAGVLAEMALAAQAGDAPSGASGPPPLAGRALEYAAEALSVVEQGRARSLLDLLRETNAEITEGVPADLLERKRENQSRQEELAARLTGLNPGGESGAQSPEELEAELARLEAELESIENQIRSASPRYAALTSARPLALADIRQQVLDEGTALLEYSLGDERSYLFAVTREAATVSRLPARAEVEGLAVELRRRLIPSSSRRALTGMVARGVVGGGAAAGGGSEYASPSAAAAYAAAAHALYRAVVEPAAPVFKQSRLLVVADGALNYVPFHALVTAAAPAGSDYSGLPYLLKTNESVLAPSASVVAAIRQQRAAGGAGDLLVVADPVFEPGDARGARADAAPPPENATRGLSFESAVSDLADEGAGPDERPSAGGAAGALARLPGTREEAQQIARLAAAGGRKAEVWLDLDASEQNVEGRDLRQYRVLHFATHGLLNAERPQFTGLVLSLVGNREGADGFLRTDEIFNLRLGSPLVMLSACETGLGREKRGEGVIGLTRAFMYAGAPTVGVSLWSVADRSTAELMADFYKNLLGGAAPPAAMRAARARMLADKRYSAPFHWAPFVLVGDWR
ncbi:MAG TPA: CHAT domain-containing protein [Pyrinomonadaceae bacterium]|nr:CHAT domain-containing protein [Pyrinomonadaceae bacterium]